jgi:arylsulfatase A-like enzyme
MVARCVWLSAVFVAALLPVPAEAGRKPNIVLILADDLGWSDVGCYGGEIPTPHVDALAARGLRFTQFYNNAVCGPSRAALLTGLYCQRVGHQGDNWNEPTDFRKCVGLGEVLKAAGYLTIMVGKWQERQSALRHGFDRFFGPMCQGKISYFDEVQLNPFFLNERRWKVPAQGFYLTDALTDQAVHFVEEATAQRRPFFLYLAHVAPHWPLHALEAEIAPHRQKYRQHGWEHWRAERFKRQREMKLVSDQWALSPSPAGVPAWDSVRDKDWQAERMAVYAAQVTALDRSVGRVMEALRRGQVEDDTLVLFLSDNGAASEGGLVPSDAGFGFGPKMVNDTWRLDRVPIRPGSGPANLPGAADAFAGYGLAWGNVSNTPWRGMKLTAYEGGIRAPFIACWPSGSAARGQITHQVGHVIDLLPTCLDIAHASYPRELPGRQPLPLDGKSLLPIFHGKQRVGHEALFWRVPQHRAVRVGDWMLVRGNDQAAWELYDLAADATQTRDGASERPQLVHDMAERWQRWAAQTGLKR